MKSPQSAAARSTRPPARLQARRRGEPVDRLIHTPTIASPAEAHRRQEELSGGNSRQSAPHLLTRSSGLNGLTSSLAFDSSTPRPGCLTRPSAGRARPSPPPARACAAQLRGGIADVGEDRLRREEEPLGDHLAVDPSASGSRTSSSRELGALRRWISRPRPARRQLQVDIGAPAPLRERVAEARAGEVLAVRVAGAPASCSIVRARVAGVEDDRGRRNPRGAGPRPGRASSPARAPRRTAPTFEPPARRWRGPPPASPPPPRCESRPHGPAARSPAHGHVIIDDGHLEFLRRHDLAPDSRGCAPRVEPRSTPPARASALASHGS